MVLFLVSSQLVQAHTTPLAIQKVVVCVQQAPADKNDKHGLPIAGEAVARSFLIVKL